MTLAGLLAIYQDGFDVCELQTSRAATLMGHNVLSTTLHQRIQVCVHMSFYICLCRCCVVMLRQCE